MMKEFCPPEPESAFRQICKIGLTSNTTFFSMFPVKVLCNGTNNCLTYTPVLYMDVYLAANTDPKGVRDQWIWAQGLKSQSWSLRLTHRNQKLTFMCFERTSFLVQFDRRSVVALSGHPSSGVWRFSRPTEF